MFVLGLGHSPTQLLFLVFIILPEFGFHLDRARTKLPFLLAFNYVMVVTMFWI